MTTQLTPSVALVVPPGWATIPLEDPAARQRAIDRAVEAAQLDDGAGAATRRELRDSLVAAATDAAVAGGSLLALSVRPGPKGVPISGSLVVTVVAGAELPEVGALPAEPDDTFDHASVGAGPVVRRVGTRESRLSEDVTVPSLSVDYWLGLADGVAHLAFSTPLVAYRDAMLELFDTLIETVRPGVRR